MKQELLIALMISHARWWFRPPRRGTEMEHAALVMSKVNRRLLALESRLRIGGFKERLMAGLSIIAWFSMSLAWIVVFYPWALAMRLGSERAHSRTVLLVSHNSAREGAPLSLLTIVQGLNRDDFEPLLLTGAEGHLAQSARALGVPTFVVPLSRCLRERFSILLLGDIYRLVISFPFVLYLLAYFPIRLVHVNSLVTPDAAIAGKLLGVKTVWHFREPLPVPRWARFKVFILGRFADRIICNSNFSRQVVARHKISDAKLAMIYNCVPRRFFNPRWGGGAFRRSLRIDGSAFLVGCVGRLGREKGQDVLINAAATVARKRPNVFFVLVGSLEDTTFVRSLEETIEKEGLLGRVILTGTRNDVAEVMAGIDVHVTPSRCEETFGRVALEAMAAGALSVVSDKGGLPEVVENGHSGLVFQSEDAPALAELLDHAIRNPELREQLTRAGRERAREVFSCCQHIRRIEGIYRELLEA